MSFNQYKWVEVSSNDNEWIKMSKKISNEYKWVWICSNEYRISSKLSQSQNLCVRLMHYPWNVGLRGYLDDTPEKTLLEGISITKTAVRHPNLLSVQSSQACIDVVLDFGRCRQDCTANHSLRFFFSVCIGYRAEMNGL